MSKPIDAQRILIATAPSVSLQPRARRRLLIAQRWQALTITRAAWPSEWRQRANGAGLRVQRAVRPPAKRRGAGRVR